MKGEGRGKRGNEPQKKEKGGSQEAEKDLSGARPWSAAQSETSLRLHRGQILTNSFHCRGERSPQAG